MEKNFFRLRQEGYSVKEIAERYGLSYSTVYKDLGFIANQEGVTREYLLECPHGEHNISTRQYEPIEPIDASAMEASFAALEDAF